MKRKPSRILHVITSINLGGAENHLKDLIQGQRSSGNEVGVAYLKGDGFWKDSYQSLGVEVYNLNINEYWNFFGVLRLKRVVNDFRPDLIHVHMPPAELFLRIALIGSPKIPVICSKHNDEPFAPLLKNKILLDWCVGRWTSVICITDAVKTYFESVLSEKFKNKLSIIHYGIDSTPWKNAEPVELFNSHEKTWVIGTVARLVPQKSLDTLLNAFYLIKTTLPEAKLVIVGAGPLEQPLKNQAKNLGVEADILWLGKRSDVPALMRAFQVFVLPSIYEGLGLVLLEAMAAKVPIVASRVSAIPEILDQGLLGTLFSPRNAVELSEKILGLYKSPDQKRLESAQKYVEENFSLKKMMSKTDEIYARSTRKTVVVTSGIFPPDIGGPASYTPKIAEALTQAGHHCTVQTYSDTPHTDNSYSFKVIRILRRQNFFIREAKALMSLIKITKKADLIYSSGANFKSIIVGKLRRIPVVVKVVGDEAWEKAQNRCITSLNLDEYLAQKNFSLRETLLNFAWRTPLRLANGTICPSKYLANIVEFYGIDSKKIKVIYNGHRNHPIPRHDLPQTTYPFWITVCRLVPWKRVDQIIESLLQFPKYHLMIVGSGPEEKKLRARADTLGLSERVRFCGQFPQNEVLNRIAQATYFILNSTYEGLPHVVLEALSQGTPVIATKVGGTPECVIHGKNGVLYEVGGTENLIAAVRAAEQQEFRFDDQDREFFTENYMIAATIHYLEENFS